MMLMFFCKPRAICVAHSGNSSDLANGAIQQGFGSIEGAMNVLDAVIGTTIGVPDNMGLRELQWVCSQRIAV